MAEAKALGGAGLRGQVAGQTALCTVGKEGAAQCFRGRLARSAGPGNLRSR